MWIFENNFLWIFFLVNMILSFITIKKNGDNDKIALTLCIIWVIYLIIKIISININENI
jgi:hypothetical protein